MTDRIRRTFGAAFLATVIVPVCLSFGIPGADAQSRTMQTIRYGEVVSAEQITIRDEPTGRGAQTGATVGAIAGYALADGSDRWLGAALGGVLGSAGGRAAEKATKTRPGWELIIRLDNGEEIGIQVPTAKKKKNRERYSAGDKVRLMSGPGGQTKVSKL
jgi:outer membrane lipoprotein SlyB